MNSKAEDIKRLTDALGGLFMKVQEVDGRCVELTQDISKTELHLIDFIGQNDTVIMREFANFLEVPFSTATGVVDKLVNRGYLRRIYS